MNKKKTKQQPEAAVPAKRSEIIEQSMAYVQCLAARVKLPLRSTAPAIPNTPVASA
jgi:hypothetical protein